MPPSIAGRATLAPKIMAHGGSLSNRAACRDAACSGAVVPSLRALRGTLLVRRAARGLVLQVAPRLHGAPRRMLPPQLPLLLVASVAVLHTLATRRRPAPRAATAPAPVAQGAAAPTALPWYVVAMLVATTSATIGLI